MLGILQMFVADMDDILSRMVGIGKHLFPDSSLHMSSFRFSTPFAESPPAVVCRWEENTTQYLSLCGAVSDIQSIKSRSLMHRFSRISIQIYNIGSEKCLSRFISCYCMIFHMVYRRPFDPSHTAWIPVIAVMPFIPLATCF